MPRSSPKWNPHQGNNLMIGNFDTIIIPETTETHIGGGIIGTVSTGADTANWSVEEYSDPTDYLGATSAKTSFGMVLRPSAATIQPKQALLWLLDHEVSPAVYRQIRFDVANEDIAFEKIVGSSWSTNGGANYMNSKAKTLILEVQSSAQSVVASDYTHSFGRIGFETQGGHVGLAVVFPNGARKFLAWDT